MNYDDYLYKEQKEKMTEVNASISLLLATAPLTHSLLVKPFSQYGQRICHYASS